MCCSFFLVPVQTGNDVRNRSVTLHKRPRSRCLRPLAPPPGRARAANNASSCCEASSCRPRAGIAAPSDGRTCGNPAGHIQASRRVAKTPWAWRRFAVPAGDPLSVVACVRRGRRLRVALPVSPSCIGWYMRPCGDESSQTWGHPPSKRVCFPVLCGRRGGSKACAPGGPP